LSYRYLLENRRPEAGERFAALAALFDPWTFRHLDDLGLGEGWRCWEVGAGGFSVPRGLAERVGTSGRVLATDIDVAWMVPAAGDALEVRRHDVIRDAPPSETFDLIHARLALVHLEDRVAALQVMIDAMRPGGWLVLEDADPSLQPLACPDERGSAEELANRLRTRIRTLMVERGADLAYGRTLPRLLRESGLRDVRAEAYFPIASPACSILEAATVRHVLDQLLAAELATPDEIDRHLGNLARGDLDLMLAPMITAWGQTLVLHDRPVVMQEDDPTHHPDPSSTSCEGSACGTNRRGLLESGTPLGVGAQSVGHWRRALPRPKGPEAAGEVTLTDASSSASCCSMNSSRVSHPLRFQCLRAHPWAVRSMLWATSRASMSRNTPAVTPSR
jgi:SAM-dependent methyltransferase